MKRKTRFIPNGERYALDFGECTARKGFAQVDTRDDAWYFGQWVSVRALRFVSYVEGDLTVIDFETAAEMRAFISEVASGDDFIGIDTLCRRSKHRQS